MLNIVMPHDSKLILPFQTVRNGNSLLSAHL